MSNKIFNSFLDHEFIIEETKDDKLPLTINVNEARSSDHQLVSLLAEVVYEVSQNENISDNSLYVKIKAHLNKIL